MDRAAAGGFCAGVFGVLAADFLTANLGNRLQIRFHRAEGIREHSFHSRKFVLEETNLNTNGRELDE